MVLCKYFIFSYLVTILKQTFVFNYINTALKWDLTYYNVKIKLTTITWNKTFSSIPLYSDGLVLEEKKKFLLVYHTVVLFLNPLDCRWHPSFFPQLLFGRLGVIEIILEHICIDRGVIEREWEPSRMHMSQWRCGSGRQGNSQKF